MEACLNPAVALKIKILRGESGTTKAISGKAASMASSLSFGTGSSLKDGFQLQIVTPEKAN
jgi:hypothetical protein